MRQDLGNINIYFGEVIDIQDVDNRAQRVRVRINGYTDNLTDEDLPWYFPWYGINYLPEVGDYVSVAIFDNIITSGFYGRKVNINRSTLSEEDYVNYLEIFRRVINDAPVSLTYKPSTGIEFINNESGMQILQDKLSLFVASNSITITPDNIILGNPEFAQAALRGDEVLKILESLTGFTSQILQLFTPTSAIMLAFTTGSATPFTASLAPAFQTLGITAQTIQAQLSILSAGILSSTLQSSKTFIE
jgi:hypothetical protein